MNSWLRRYRGYLILSLVHIVAFAGFTLWRQPAPSPIRIIDPTPQPTSTPRQVTVYVSGAVAHPDVYMLPDGSRVKDALQAAGGLRGDAVVSALNLATLLRDGQEVHVPVTGETPPAPVSLSPDASAADGSAATGSGALVNLNTATAAELETLPGIGPALAQRIVEERAANGPYASADDLTRVRGIGPATVDKLRALVTVG